MESRKELYQKVFNCMKIKFAELGENLLIMENEIKKIKANFFNNFDSLNLNKYNLDIFQKIQYDLDELKIELQISALNGKIKSLDMKEFSNIISVIGSSLLEEASKISIRFNQLKSIFSEIMETFQLLKQDFYSMKKIEYSFSEKIFLMDRVIENKALSKLKENKNLLLEIFQKLISDTKERLDNISYFKSFKFQINFKHFKKKVGINLNKIKLLLQDFYNFVFKVNYLTLITKIEVGKLKEDKFIMVVNNLDLITEKIEQINNNIIAIYNYYLNLFNKMDKMYSEVSVKLRFLIFRDYREIILEAQEELEGFLSFLNNELQKLEGELNVNNRECA